MLRSVDELDADFSDARLNFADFCLKIDLKNIIENLFASRVLPRVECESSRINENGVVEHHFVVCVHRLHPNKRRPIAFVHCREPETRKRARRRRRKKVRREHNPSARGFELRETVLETHGRVAALTAEFKLKFEFLLLLD